MYCKKCGKQINPEDKFCNGCGATITNENIVQEQTLIYNNVENQKPVDISKENNTTKTVHDEGNSNQSQSNSNQSQNSDNKGLFSLLLGIGSIFFSFFACLAIPLAVIGIVLSSKEQPKTTKGKAGKILSIIGIVSVFLSTLIILGVYNEFKSIKDFEPSIKDNFEIINDD